MAERERGEFYKIKEEERKKKEGGEIREEKKSRRREKNEKKKENRRQKEKKGKRKEERLSGSLSLRNNTPYIVVCSCSVSCNLKRVHAN